MDPKPFPPEKSPELHALIFRGRKIEAIKLHREHTGLGLKEAKDAVEAIEAALRKQSPEKFSAPPKSGGCASVIVGCCALGAATGAWLYFS